MDKKSLINNLLSLYIHIPFCLSKCRYCGFSSTPYDRDAADAFLSVLEREMEVKRPLLQDRPILSLYIGGGTPTTLSEQQLERLFVLIKHYLAQKLPPEVTVEMNPGTVSLSNLEKLVELGANRLSIGAQSFSDSILQRLGRTHRAVEIDATVRNARTAGFGSIGLDLMYGIPEQTPEEWTRTIEAALSLEPAHLSIYCLSIEPGTAFADALRTGRISLPGDDLSAQMYETARSSILSGGYGQYELSNFARPGHACRHNLHYWDRGEFLGFGPSAWSFAGDRRWMNVHDLRTYIDRTVAGGSLIDQEDIIGPAEAASERLMLGLRRTEGMEEGMLHRMLELSSLKIQGLRIRKLNDDGLLETVEGKVRLTPRGMLLANEVIERLIP